MHFGRFYAGAAAVAVALSGVVCLVAPMLGADVAKASEVVYTPINPTFGGNPLNASQLQFYATAQKPSPPAATTQSTQQSSTQQFLQMLQSQLYASLASSVSTAITGQSSQASGTIRLNTMTISWYTASDGKHITITDSSTGQVYRAPIWMRRAAIKVRMSGSPSVSMIAAGAVTRKAFCFAE